MQVVAKEKVQAKEVPHEKCRGRQTSRSGTNVEDLFLDSRIVRPNLRAPVTLPGFPILVIEIQILFLEILILVPREILEIRIPVKTNVNSVCFAKCC